MSLSEIPTPDLEDSRFAPYWAGAAEQKLMLPRCQDCGSMNWPPRRRCSSCHSREFIWEQRQQTGRLFSWIVVGHPTAPGYQETPYSVGVIALDDAEVRLMGEIVGLGPEEIEMDMPLVAQFVPAGEFAEFTLIQWRSASRMP